MSDTEIGRIPLLMLLAASWVTLLLLLLLLGWSIIANPEGTRQIGPSWQIPLLGVVLLSLFGSALMYVGLRRRNQGQADNPALYRELFRLALDARLVVGADDGRVLDANSAAVLFFQRERSRLLGLGSKELINLDAATLASAGDTGDTLHSRDVSPNGEPRELEVSVVEVQNTGQQPILQLQITDVTRRERTLKQLNESQEKLTAILNASSDGILLADEQGQIQVFSPAAEILFGYLKEEILGRPISQLIPACATEDGSPALSSWLPDGMSSGLGAVRETYGLRNNSEEIPVRVSLNGIMLDGHRHYVALVQDLSEQRRNEKKLDYLERRDLLTGLLNRREFERRLDALLSFTEHVDAEYVLCYMDVDQFKVVNDTCGHVAGDELLKQLAILIKSHFKGVETIARTGGDEFAALLTDCTEQRAEDLCNGLMQTVRNFLFTWQDQSFDVALSIGLAGFRPHAESASQVLSQADVACHMAKRLGRDRVHLYHQSDLDLIRHHGDMHLVSDITQALNEARFHLYAQPIIPVNAVRGSDTHYEILVRMVDAGGQLVIPEHFIPAAERYILMPAIDRWVINRLFELQAENLRRWSAQRDGKPGFLFGINLSGTSLTDEGFLNYLKRQFLDHDIPYNSICFEITETAAVANLERAKALIDELKQLGCSFALDDFGTGLSSYSYLKVLPVDYLKIDGSFVRNMTEDPVDYAMVDSINQIGHILGLKTIAEWAENLGTLTQLRALNVDFAQGYGVGDMVSVEEFRLPE